MNMRWIPRIDQDRCTGCGDCVSACPEKSLVLRNGKTVLPDPDRCSFCMNCESICPEGAIELPFLIIFDPRQKGANS